MKLFVGIDVSSEKLDTCFLNSEDHILLEISLQNNIVGAGEIKDNIIRFTEHIQCDRIIVGIEATSVYSFHSSTSLAEDAELGSLGIEVFVMKAIRDSYRLGKVMQDSIDVVLASYVMMIKTIKKQIKEFDKVIQKLFEILPESKSLPGIGPVYATGIMAKIGQIKCFENEAKIAKYDGVYCK